MRAFFLETVSTACYNLCYNLKGAIMAVTKLVKIGNSVGVILPKALIDDFGLDVGAEVQINKNNENIIISNNNSNFSAYVDAAREIMRDYDLTMRELAK